jgi:hypothetical protein
VCLKHQCSGNEIYILLFLREVNQMFKNYLENLMCWLLMVQRKKRIAVEVLLCARHLALVLDTRL